MRRWGIVLLGGVALLLAGASLKSGAGTPAVAQPPTSEALPETDASVPAREVTMIGATPEEAGAAGQNETWGIGEPGGSAKAGEALVRYTDGGGWSRVEPSLLSAAGQSLAGFKLDRSPLAGQMTPGGVGVLLGTVPAPAGQSGEPEVVLVRVPGGSFQETKPVPAEGETLQAGETPLLKKGQQLFAGGRAPLLAPLEESGGKAGALVVPVSQDAKAVEDEVLHWNGGEWSAEPIEVPAQSSEELRVLAIGASAPANAWLLAQLATNGSYPPGAVALFHRVREATGWLWKPVAPAGGSALPLTVPVQGGAEPFAVPGAGGPPKVTAQALTVTSEGVWVDGERADARLAATLFLKLTGGSIGTPTSWCAPGGPPESGCQHELPEPLPAVGRSIAWANSSLPYGERVITGLTEGVSLRLEGDTFKRVLGLGGTAGKTSGAALGAAFSSATDGWLGSPELPVHLLPHPLLSRLTPWPVPFRHALTAIAPQPGAPAGALTSEALAVGDQGEVARFKPGAGWQPESLFGPGGKIRTPRLRAVAWPRPNRAYAVGDEDEMWLWRGETGLWEPDPATPPNFRGNLLGIAFDPNNPARGYAIGSQEVGLGGVLLRYGKTWTQERTCEAGVGQPCLPPQVAGASFTSIAFAGSEVLVVYRKLLNPNSNEYAGGLLVNAGSGWQIDGEAATASGADAPLGVAGLPDGGAAFSAVGPEGTRVLEREAAAAGWHPAPVAPPLAAAGSLALFREGGALRAIIASGGANDNYENERESPPPPGSPPNLIGAYPIGRAGSESGLLRQTASGWNDESHELNPVSEPAGNYSFYDLPYRPEPVLAVLIDPTGTQGWAVGGEIYSEPNLDTASIERYPADGVAPLGAGGSEVALEVPAPHPGAPPADATFAIAGGAQCAAACADRALAGIGPDVWLQAALARAHQIGVRAFLYTGPRLTTDAVNGLTKAIVPFGRELERYASLLASGGLPVYAAVTPQDLDARPEDQGSETTLERAFGRFFGAESLGTGLALAPNGGLGTGAPPSCASTVGCEGAYYALNSENHGVTVRVIVLDDSGEVDASQLQWLAKQLESAKAEHHPAIVMGNADLKAQVSAHDVQAKELAQTLVCDGASAYFFDAPEENVEKPLAPPLGPCAKAIEPIPTYGSGTLGYVNVIGEHFGSFHGASGFLLGQVEFATYNPQTNVARVSARLIPNIGELALEAKDGILLRRSNPALFNALARRPRAGSRSHGGEAPAPEVDPYIPIPSNCVGSPGCTNGEFLLPEYSFISSRPDRGGFVVRNLASTDPHAVLVNAKGEPIRDEPRNAKGEPTPGGQFERNAKGEPINERGEVVPATQSGLFCAYNAGPTIVTIDAGGLSSSLPVTVQAGSVRQPCGTVPLKEVRASQHVEAAPPPPPPTPTPTPTEAAPATSPPVPLPPLPPPATVPVIPARPVLPPAPPAPPFFLPTLAPVVLAAFVPPPLPPAANPTPPSGTSAVTSPVEAAQREEEEEEATESVSNQALAYHPAEHEPSPVYVLGVVLLAAFAGASIRGRPRRGRRDVRVAPATISGARAQRRAARSRRLP